MSGSGVCPAENLGCSLRASSHQESLFKWLPHLQKPGTCRAERGGPAVLGANGAARWLCPAPAPRRPKLGGFGRQRPLLLVRDAGSAGGFLARWLGSCTRVPQLWVGKLSPLGFAGRGRPQLVSAARGLRPPAGQRGIVSTAGQGSGREQPLRPLAAEAWSWHPLTSSMFCWPERGTGGSRADDRLWALCLGGQGCRSCAGCGCRSR